MCFSFSAAEDDYLTLPTALQQRHTCYVKIYFSALSDGHLYLGPIQQRCTVGNVLSSQGTLHCLLREQSMFGSTHIPLCKA